jgi:hypothetical protein
MIYFISYPKCGRTWCRTIINEYARRSKATPKKHVWTHIKFGNQTDPEDKGEKWLKEDVTRILLKRNDLDVLVSLFHDQIVRVAAKMKVYKKKGIDAYVLDKSDHLLRFKKKSRELTYDYEFSYEKMSKYPFKTFLPVMEIVFGEVNLDVFRETIEFCHFDNLSKLEREGKIDMRGSKNFHKTRKGKVGSHKEELQKETIRKLQKKFKK